MNEIASEIIAFAFELMAGAPWHLEEKIKEACEREGLAYVFSQDDIISYLKSAAGNDKVLHVFHMELAVFDQELSDRKWTLGTRAHSKERREIIYQCLSICDDLKSILETKCPLALDDNRTSVISVFHAEWYDEKRAREHSFYWPSYKKYLGMRKGFSSTAIGYIDSDTNRILKRLGDPLSLSPVPTRGLVVGYVQSGKTTNFTALIAKAIDAGYRLVIVIAGTLDILRNQTQRRLDMELVGKENILRYSGDGDDTDYIDDSDWGTRFIEYGVNPEENGGSNILRMTRAKADFDRLNAGGIDVLSFKRKNNLKRLNDEENLFSCDTRLFVVKKVASRLDGLVRDLESVRKYLGDVPALIIDDESDQASVNTIKPSKENPSDRAKRTTINNNIVKLLKILPRAQYIGYTATPVANVFINPDDPEDLFPRDYVISLREPDDYFGARRFHDLDGQRYQDGLDRSNEAAYVRDIRSQIDNDDKDLEKAIDLFVLTGAMKLYRRDCGIKGDYRHHAMLVHISHLQSEHEVLANRVRRLWDRSGFETGAARSRLEELFECDIKPVSLARSKVGGVPESFRELEKSINEVFSKINAKEPVKIVNGTESGTSPNFDKEAFWGIIVGGAKLARGYTIEGLTISYFRRTAKAKDTMMQMGRWFGYRPGYEDLVRLFIGRDEVLGKRKVRDGRGNPPREIVDKIDLLKAFKGMCQEERQFRSQLVMYADLDGSARITPKQIPPLVDVYFPEIPPVARNKMWNAELVCENYGGKWIQPTLFPEDSECKKQALLDLESLVSGGTEAANERQTEVGLAVVKVVPHRDVVRFLEGRQWSGNGKIAFLPRLNYLKGQGADPAIDDWAIVFFLLTKADRKEQRRIKGLPRAVTIIERQRTGANRAMEAISTPDHRATVAPITGTMYGAIPGPLATYYASPKRGVILVYLAKAGDEQGLPAVVFEILPPENGQLSHAQYRVRQKNADLVVDRS